MSRTRRGTILVAAACSVAVACQSLLDLGDDRPDASTFTDAGTEAFASEAGAIIGAPTDAEELDGAWSCAQTFCDDFDHGALALRWSLPAPTIGRAPALTDASVVSAPMSMSAQSIDGAPTFVEKRFDVGDASRMFVVFWANVLEGATDGPLVSEIRFIGAAEHVSSTIQLFTGPTEHRSSITHDDGGAASSPTLPHDAGWRQYVFTVNFTRDGTVRGQLVGGYPLVQAIDVPQHIEIDLGIRSAQPGHVLIDNVLIDLR